MKSIRTKISLCLILTVLAGLVASGASSIALNYNSTMATVEQMMSETAVLAAGRAQQELASYKNVVMEVGHIPQLADPDVSVEEKQAIMDERVAMHGFQRGNIIGANGISIFDGKTILTGSMCVRRCREIFMCPSRWSVRLPGSCPLWLQRLFTPRKPMALPSPVWFILCRRRRF